MNDFKIGIQMYSIRDVVEEGMENALKYVAEMGYSCVEFAGYYGESAENLKRMLDQNKLEAISVHDSYEELLENPKEKIEFIKIIGAEYFAIPKLARDKHKGSDVFEKTVEDIRRAAEILKENGIQLLYHNHEFEFEKHENRYLMDWLFDKVSPEMMNPEIDTCWVNFAGIDPCEYIEKYAGKTDVIHLKDFICSNINALPIYDTVSRMKKAGKKITRDGSGFEYRPVGAGVQDFESIIKTSEKSGTKYLIVEQDFHPERASLKDAKLSIDYLNRFLKNNGGVGIC